MNREVQPEGQCPFRGTRVEGGLGDGPTLEDWWPGRLRVELLHVNSDVANPLGPDFDYAKAFESLDLAALKQDIFEMLENSQSWWPADWGHYGPQMVRMSWHSAGTYRIADGRGGTGSAMQRFLPISSWIDNANTDKSRRLLWPIKQKYGRALSWADLIALTGNCAMESMGLPMVGFGGGRIDAWEPDASTYWGPENEMQGRERWEGRHDEAHYDLENPVAASEMSLIYVNPEGPGGEPDPLGSAREIRETFARMGMNDEETVALVAGGHAFGKSHGAVSPDNMGPGPEGAKMEHQGFGWMNSAGSGNAEFTISNGIEGAWTSTPLTWNNEYFDNLFGYEWELTESPAGAKQWKPTDASAADKVPDAHIDGKRHFPMMMTSDIALKEDPDYRKVSERFHRDFDAFTDAFSKAWFKLMHRDMGPKSRYLGPEVPEEDFPWQDPIPACDHPLVDEADVATLKRQILDTGVGVPALAGAAWASASTFRGSDKRGGANGGRLRLAPQKDWEVNDPEQLSRVLSALESVQSNFNGTTKDATGSGGGRSDGKRISMADLIVLGGCAAVEKAAADAGVEVSVPFVPGRMDASEEQTDVEMFEWLHPIADGFRNFQKRQYKASTETLLIDRAALLNLSAPELTALMGGMRALGTNWNGSTDGLFTDRPGVLTNDFFVELLDMSTEWKPTDETEMRFEGRDRESGEAKYTATRADLVFGSNEQLRNVAEVYAAADGHEKLVHDFVAAWDKVMMADRFDLG